MWCWKSTINRSQLGAQGRSTAGGWSNPNHVAVDETVIPLNDEWCYLYAAVDPDTNGLSHTKLERIRREDLTYGSLAELREKHDGDDATLLVDGATPLKNACRRHDLEIGSKRHRIRNSIKI